MTENEKRLLKFLANEPNLMPWALIEKVFMIENLRRSKGNKSQAARQMGVTRNTFIARLRKHGLDHFINEAPCTSDPSPNSTST